MFDSIVDLLKFVYTSDLFFECFSMLWTVAVVCLVFRLIRGL